MSLSAELVLQITLLLALTAAPLVLVWQYPVETTIALLAYLAFEEFLLAFVPDPFSAMARIVPDVLILVGAVSALQRTLRSKGFRWRVITWPEMCIACTGLLGLAVGVARHVPIVFMIIGAQWLFRYSLVYAIWRLAGDPSRRQLFVRVLILVVGLEAALGIIQAGLQSAGVPILDWMQSSIEHTAVGGIDIVTGGSKQQLGLPFYVFGTLGRYHRFGIFEAAGGIVLAFLLLYKVNRDDLARVTLAAIGLAIVLSTSRQALLLVLMAVLGAAWLRLGMPERVSRIVRGLTMLAVATVIVTVATGAVALLRSASPFVARLMNVGTLGFRAYYMAIIVPRVLHASHYLGFGIGTFASRPHVLANPGLYIQWGFPGQWTFQYSYDSEWAILLGQYGVIGFVLFYAGIVGFGLRALRALSSTPDHSVERVLVATTACYASVLPFLGVVGAELGSRTTAYIVWSVLGAAMSGIGTRRGDIAQSGPQGRALSTA